MTTDKVPATDIKELWESLTRGGEHWSEEVVLNDNEDGFVAVFFLIDKLPHLSQIYISRYIREFLKARGWKTSTRFSPAYVRVEMSRAASKA